MPTKKIKKITLKNSSGAQAEILTLGAALTKLTVPDANGQFSNVVLSHADWEQYWDNPDYIGVVVGRCANRIERGHFSIDGNDYQVVQNNGNNHLHGGSKGFSRVPWSVEARNTNSVTLSYLSADGEDGYPGNLNVLVTYELTDKNQLAIEYRAATDKTTIVNLTQHSYFNLSGQPAQNIFQHWLRINANHFTPTSATQIPLGEIANVAGTPFDLNQFTRLSKTITQSHPQIDIAGGLDHNFVLNKSGTDVAAELYEPSSGRSMRVRTDQPCLQVYSGNGLGRSAAPSNFNAFAGVCLETQGFPNAINQPNFPTTILSPGQTYKHRTQYEFSIHDPRENRGE